MLDRSKTYAYDSRQIKAGDCYICLPKGESYIEDALKMGATDVVHLNRKEFARSANDYFDHPTKRVKLVGITGTNGKTSVAYFTAQLLQSMGHKVLVIGTINSRLTTPESWDILDQIKHHADNGGTHVVLEVSSHGIDQYRVHGFYFDVKCLTNITQDHLDYHETFEKYKETKLHFMDDYPGHAIYSEDVPLITPDDIAQLNGSFHVKNVSSARAICQWLGEDTQTLNANLNQLLAPKGRFQTVSAGQSFAVIIDFAHTPDALEHVLKDALLQASGNKKRLKVVFGCGGDRDKSKREAMGMIAERYSDEIYLTADNSRSEATLDIIDEIKEKMSLSAIAMITLDRQAAISAAIQSAKSGDVILIAGKGHESMQHCNGFSYGFNDDDVAFNEIIRQRKFQVNQSWVLNQPDANADVLFISRKLIALLKITYSQFKRAIPTPSNAKIKDYLAKIKGEKIIVLEDDGRCPISDMLMRILRGEGSGVAYIFDDQKSLEHNLVGLTLIEQTAGPLMIRINPNGIGKIKKLIDIISPDHIVIGDILNKQGFIDPSCIKSIRGLSGESTHQPMIWYFSQMADVNDCFESIKDHYFIHAIQASSWIEYMQFLIEDLLIKLDLYNQSPRDALLRQLMASLWVTKVNLINVKSPLYVVDWTGDMVDATQKITYFQNNAQAIFYYIYNQSDSQQLVDELKRNHQVSSDNIIIKNTTGNESEVSMIQTMNLHSDAVHVLWKTTRDPLTILEGIQ